MELKRVFKMERRKERKREQFTSQDCTSQLITNSFLLRNPTLTTNLNHRLRALDLFQST